MEIDFSFFFFQRHSILLSLIQTNGARILGFSVNSDRWIFFICISWCVFELYLNLVTEEQCQIKSLFLNIPNSSGELKHCLICMYPFQVCGTVLLKGVFV